MLSLKPSTCPYFKRHYNIPERPGVAKVMLDTQYRMHRDICEFYQEKLRTAVADNERPLAPCQFPWPSPARKVFIQCSRPENLGRQSKSNKGQVELCRRVCELLSSLPEPAPSLQSGSDTVISTCLPPEIAILTPCTHQKDLLKSAIRTSRAALGHICL
jgi:AAA domain